MKQIEIVQSIVTGISHNGFRPNNNQSKQGVTA